MKERKTKGSKKVFSIELLENRLLLSGDTTEVNLNISAPNLIMQGNYKWSENLQDRLVVNFKDAGNGVLEHDVLKVTKSSDSTELVTLKINAEVTDSFEDGKPRHAGRYTIKLSTINELSLESFDSYKSYCWTIVKARSVEVNGAPVSVDNPFDSSVFAIDSVGFKTADADPHGGVQVGKSFNGKFQVLLSQDGTSLELHYIGKVASVDNSIVKPQNRVTLKSNDTLLWNIYSVPGDNEGYTTNNYVFDLSRMNELSTSSPFVISARTITGIEGALSWEGAGRIGALDGFSHDSNYNFKIADLEGVTDINVAKALISEKKIILDDHLFYNNSNRFYFSKSNNVKLTAQLVDGKIGLYYNYSKSLFTPSIESDQSGNNVTVTRIIKTGDVDKISLMELFLSENISNIQVNHRAITGTDVLTDSTLGKKWRVLYDNRTDPDTGLSDKNNLYFAPFIREQVATSLQHQSDRGFVGDAELHISAVVDGIAKTLTVKYRVNPGHSDLFLEGGVGYFDSNVEGVNRRADILAVKQRLKYLGIPVRGTSETDTPWRSMTAKNFDFETKYQTLIVNNDRFNSDSWNAKNPSPFYQALTMFNAMTSGKANIVYGNKDDGAEAKSSKDPSKAQYVPRPTTPRVGLNGEIDYSMLKIDANNSRAQQWLSARNAPFWLEYVDQDVDPSQDQAKPESGYGNFTYSNGIYGTAPFGIQQERFCTSWVANAITYVGIHSVVSMRSAGFSIRGGGDTWHHANHEVGMSMDLSTGLKGYDMNDVSRLNSIGHFVARLLHTLPQDASTGEIYRSSYKNIKPLNVGGHVDHYHIDFKAPNIDALTFGKKTTVIDISKYTRYGINYGTGGEISQDFGASEFILTRVNGVALTQEELGFLNSDHYLNLGLGKDGSHLGYLFIQDYSSFRKGRFLFMAGESSDEVTFGFTATEIIRTHIDLPTTSSLLTVTFTNKQNAPIESLNLYNSIGDGETNNTLDILALSLHLQRLKITDNANQPVVLSRVWTDSLREALIKYQKQVKEKADGKITIVPKKEGVPFQYNATKTSGTFFKLRDAKLSNASHSRVLNKAFSSQTKLAFEKVGGTVTALSDSLVQDMVNPLAKQLFAQASSASQATGGGTQLYAAPPLAMASIPSENITSYINIGSILSAYYQTLPAGSTVAYEQLSGIVKEGILSIFGTDIYDGTGLTVQCMYDTKDKSIKFNIQGSLSLNKNITLDLSAISRIISGSATISTLFNVNLDFSCSIKVPENIDALSEDDIVLSSNDIVYDFRALSIGVSTSLGDEDSISDFSGINASGKIAQVELAAILSNLEASYTLDFRFKNKTDGSSIITASDLELDNYELSIEQDSSFDARILLNAVSALATGELDLHVFSSSDKKTLSTEVIGAISLPQVSIGSLLSVTNAVLTFNNEKKTATLTAESASLGKQGIAELTCSAKDTPYAVTVTYDMTTGAMKADVDMLTAVIGDPDGLNMTVVSSDVALSIDENGSFESLTLDEVTGSIPNLMLPDISFDRLVIENGKIIASIFKRDSFGEIVYKKDSQGNLVLVKVNGVDTKVPEISKTYDLTEMKEIIAYVIDRAVQKIVGEFIQDTTNNSKIPDILNLTQKAQDNKALSGQIAPSFNNIQGLIKELTPSSSAIDYNSTTKKLSFHLEFAQEMNQKSAIDLKALFAQKLSLLKNVSNAKLNTTLSGKATVKMDVVLDLNAGDALDLDTFLGKNGLDYSQSAINGVKSITGTALTANSAEVYTYTKNSDGTYGETKEYKTSVGLLTANARLKFSFSNSKTGESGEIDVEIPKEWTTGKEIIDGKDIYSAPNRSASDLARDINRAISEQFAALGLSPLVKVVADAENRLSLVGEVVEGGEVHFAILSSVGLGFEAATAGYADDIQIQTRDGAPVYRVTFTKNVGGVTTRASSIQEIIDAIVHQTGGKVTAVANAKNGFSLIDNSTTQATITEVDADTGNSVTTSCKFKITRGSGSQLASLLGICKTADSTIIDSAALAGIPLGDRITMGNLTLVGDLTVSVDDAFDANVGPVEIGVTANGSLKYVISSKVLSKLDNSQTSAFFTLIDIAKLADRPDENKVYKIETSAALSTAAGANSITFTAAAKVDGLHSSIADSLKGSIVVSVQEDQLVVDTSGFASLTKMENFDLSTVLDQLPQVIDKLVKSTAMDQKLPFIDQSMNELINLKSTFENQIYELKRGGNVTLQKIEQLIENSLKLADENFSLVNDNGVLKFSLYYTESFSKSKGIKLYTPGLKLGNGDADVLSTSAKLNASGSVETKLEFGVSIDNPADVYVYDSTFVKATLDASATNISANFSAGPLGLFVKAADGLESFITLKNGVVEVNVKDGTGKRALAEIGTNLTADVTAEIGGELPVFFPTDQNFLGTIKIGEIVNNNLITRPDGSSVKLLSTNGTIVTFDVKSVTVKDTDPAYTWNGTVGLDVSEIVDGLKNFEFEKLGFFDKLDLAVEGVDYFLTMVQERMDAKLSNVEIKGLGKPFQDGSNIIDNFRDTFIAGLRAQLSSVSSRSVTDIAKYIADLLGSKGANILKAGASGLFLNNTGTVYNPIENIRYSSNVDNPGVNPNEMYAQWNFNLGQVLQLANKDLAFDLGVPGIGLQGSANLDLTLDWSLNMGFGIDNEGFYIFMPEENDISIKIRAGSYDPTLKGSLAILEVKVAPNDDDGNTSHLNNKHSITGELLDDNYIEITGGLSADIFSGDDLRMSDIGDISSAKVSLELATRAELDLMLGILSSAEAGQFPTITSDFLFEWELSNTGNESGVITVLGFNNVQLNLGEFISNVVKPMVDKVKKYVEPVDKIAEFLDADIPVISDVWQPIDFIDLAGMVTGRDMTSVRHLIQQIRGIKRLAVDLLGTTSKTAYIQLGSLFIAGGTEEDAKLGDDIDVLKSSFDPSNLSFKKTKVLAKDSDEQKAINGLSSAVAAAKAGQYGFAFPIFDNPAEQVFGLLLGKNATLVTYDMAPMDFNFRWSQFFPIIGPLGAEVGVELGAKIDLAFGYDTLGVQQFVKSGYRSPAKLINGFYISDTDHADGTGSDVPELTLYGKVWAGGSINLFIAKGGVNGELGIYVDFNFHDPDHDGKIRLAELAETYDDISVGSLPVGIGVFDISGAVKGRVYAYVKFLGYSKDWTLIEATIWDFNINIDRDPALANVESKDVTINAGKYAKDRLEGDTSDRTEKFTIDTGTGDVTMKDYNGKGTDKTRKYGDGVKNANKITIDAGEGNDEIFITGNGSQDIEIDGGNGDDIINLSGYGGTGRIIIRGGAGKDTITGGAGTSVLIIGGKGNDTIVAGSTGALIFGDEAVIRASSAMALYKPEDDGNDDIKGGSGDDVIIGGGGDDTISGRAGFDKLIGDSANLSFVRIGMVGNDPKTGYADLSTVVVSSTESDKNNPRGGNDIILGGADDDTIYGGTGDDTLDGGANRDLIYGESGNDIILGGSGDDSSSNSDPKKVNGGLFGGDGNDIIFGDRPVTGFNINNAFIEMKGQGRTLELSKTDTGDSTYGSDTIFGGVGNDILFGDSGDDGVNFNIIGGDDTIEGEAGNDLINGDGNSGAADGKDKLFGGYGNDTIYGGLGSDEIDGGAATDIVFGDRGHHSFDENTVASESERSQLKWNNVVYGSHTLEHYGYVFKTGDHSGIKGLKATVSKGDKNDGHDLIQTSQGNDFLDGQGGNDAYIVTFLGGKTDAMVNVSDSGTGNHADTRKEALGGEDAYDEKLKFGVHTVDPDNIKKTGEQNFGKDKVIIQTADSEKTGEGVDNRLLFRTSSSGLSMAASINDTITTEKGRVISNYERVNFWGSKDDTDVGIEGLTAFTYGGDDTIALDDMQVFARIHAGSGNDKIQVGQLFNTDRSYHKEDTAPADGIPDFNGIQEEDQFTTDNTTIGYVTSGISKSTTIDGGDGNDDFVVFRNKALLDLNGDAGDDSFLLKAFALKDKPSDFTCAQIGVGSGTGKNRISYVKNAPVHINGGSGLDKVTVLGTEKDDKFIVTENGVYGAGLNMKMANIESFVVDGGEGNDSFYIFSTSTEFVTQIFGGKGSDSFYVNPELTTDLSSTIDGIIQDLKDTVVDATDKLLPDVDFDTFYATMVGIADLCTLKNMSKTSIFEHAGFGYSGYVGSIINNNLDPLNLGVASIIKSIFGRIFRDESDPTKEKELSGSEILQNLFETPFNALPEARSGKQALDKTMKGVLHIHGEGGAGSLVGGKTLMLDHEKDEPIADGLFTKVESNGLKLEVELNSLETKQAFIEKFNRFMSQHYADWNNIDDITELEAQTNKLRNKTVTLINPGSVLAFREISDISYANNIVTIELNKSFDTDVSGKGFYFSSMDKSFFAEERDQKDILVVNQDSNTATVGGIEKVSSDGYMDEFEATWSDGTTNHIAKGVANNILEKMVLDAPTYNIYGFGMATEDREVNLSVEKTTVAWWKRLFGEKNSETVSFMKFKSGINFNNMEVLEMNLDGTAGHTVDVKTTLGREDGYKTQTIINTGSGNDTIRSSGIVSDPEKVFYSGTVSSVNEVGGLELSFEGAVGTTDYLAGLFVEIVAEDGFVYRREIDSFKFDGTITTLTLSREFPLNVTGKTFTIKGMVLAYGKLSKGNAGTIFAADSTMTDKSVGYKEAATVFTHAELGKVNSLKGRVLEVITGYNKDGSINVERREIIAHEGNTVTVSSPFEYKVSDDSKYEFRVLGMAQGSLMVNSGAGDDKIIIGENSTIDTILIGGAGTDTITVGSGKNVIFGDDGLVEYADENGVVVTRFGDKDSTVSKGISQTDGVDRNPKTLKTTLTEHNGDDIITANGGRNFVFGGGGADTIALGDSQGDDVVFGDFGTVVYEGTGAKVAWGDEEHTRVKSAESLDFAEGGNDIITTGPGADIIIGGAGGDRINSDENGNPIGNHEGNDVIIGDNGAVFYDIINGTPKVREISTLGTNGGDDKISTLDGDDIVLGGVGSDIINAGNGTGLDVILGDNGQAYFLNREDGKRFITKIVTTDPTFGGNDTIIGGDGDDLIVGGAGSDYINIDSNKNVIGTDTGNDVIIGDSANIEFDIHNGVQQVRKVTTISTETGGDDFIYAGEGDDVVIGGTGSDLIDGGAGTGNDVILGDNGDITFANLDASRHFLTNVTTFDPELGGNDTIVGGEGDDVIVGGTGSDYINIDSNKNVIGTDTGNDVIIGDSANIEFDIHNGVQQVRKVTTISTETGGDDYIYAGEGDDIVIGGTGSDFIDGGAGSGNDVILGDNGDITFVNLDANRHFLTNVTTIYPERGGNDTIVGGDGNDVIVGGTGSDYINIDSNKDVIGTDTGNDVIIGDSANIEFDIHNGVQQVRKVTTISTETGGDDFIYAGEGDDIVIGGTGADFIDGGAGTGNDVILGDNGDISFVNLDATHHFLTKVTTFDPNRGGNDTIVGGDGDDVIIAGTGSDLVNVSATGAIIGTDTGNDVIIGDSATIDFDTKHAVQQVLKVTTLYTSTGGDDKIYAGEGDDIIIGGTGADFIDGGVDAGNDVILGDNGDISFVNLDANRHFLTNVTTFDPELGGDDTIVAGDGNDVVIGGTGVDYINMDAAGNVIGTDTGDDIIIGDSANIVYDTKFGVQQVKTVTTIFTATGGDDKIYAGEGDDIIIGGTGADVIDGGVGAGNDIILGDNGDITFDNQSAAKHLIQKVTTIDIERGASDSIISGAGNDIVIGGSGSDLINMTSTSVAIGTDEGDDIMIGDNGDITFDTSKGTSLISLVKSAADAYSGTDKIFAGNGNDIVIAGAGGDIVDAGTGTGNDVVLGDYGYIKYDTTTSVSRIDDAVSTDLTVGGDDDIIVGNGDDVVIGGVGSDYINAKRGTKEAVLDNDQGTDIVVGDNGYVDFVRSADGVNYVRTIQASVKDSTVQTDANFDTNGGDDVIYTGNGNDVVIGGVGSDFIDTGAGNDRDVVMGDNGRVHMELVNVPVDHGVTVKHLLLQEMTSVSLTTGGNDDIVTGDGDDAVIAGLGNDTVNYNRLTNTAIGTNDTGNDIVIGDNGRIFPTLATDPNGQTVSVHQAHSFGLGAVAGGDDIIYTFSGNDVVIGGQGSDKINTAGDGTDRDTIVGDDGVINLVHRMTGYIDFSNDLHEASALSSTADTGYNNDTITAGKGSDVVLGGAGSDTIDVSGGDTSFNWVVGDNGRVSFAPGTAVLKAESVDDSRAIGGNDTITTDNGVDVAIGGVGNDTITTNAGGDYIIGDGGKIEYDGTSNTAVSLISNWGQTTGGVDTINSGTGIDYILSGRGADAVNTGVDSDADILVQGNGSVYPKNGNFIQEEANTGTDTVVDGNGTVDYSNVKVWNSSEPTSAYMVGDLRKYNGYVYKVTTTTWANYAPGTHIGAYSWAQVAKL